MKIHSACLLLLSPLAAPATVGSNAGNGGIADRELQENGLPSDSDGVVSPLSTNSLWKIKGGRRSLMMKKTNAKNTMEIIRPDHVVHPTSKKAKGAPTASPTTNGSSAPPSQPGPAPKMMMSKSKHSPTASPTRDIHLSSEKTRSPSPSAQPSPSLKMMMSKSKRSPTASPTQDLTKSPSHTSQPSSSHKKMMSKSKRSPTASPTQDLTKSPSHSAQPSSSPKKSSKSKRSPTDDMTNSPSHSAQPSSSPKKSSKSKRSPTDDMTKSPSHSAQPSSSPKKSSKSKRSPTASPTDIHRSSEKTNSPSPSAQPSGSTKSSSKSKRSPTAPPTSAISNSPTHIPTNSPTKIPTLNPTKAPTAKPSHQPSSGPTKIPTALPTSVPSTEPTPLPSWEPSNVPSSIPSDMPSSVPSDMPSSVPSSLPSSQPSVDTFMSACRCDATATCTSQPLPRGNDLLLCVFARGDAEFGSIDKLEFVQGSLEEKIVVDNNSTGVYRACMGQVCMVQTPISLDFFGEGRPNGMTASGTASVIVASDTRKVRDRRLEDTTLEMDFGTDIALDQGVVGLDGEMTVDDEDGVRVVAWLAPLLAAIAVVGVGAFLVYRASNSASAS